MLGKTFCALAAAAAALTAQVGAQGSPDILTTVGTSIATTSETDAQVFLLWSSDTRSLLDGKRFAIFRKSGHFDAATPYGFAGFVEAQNSPVIIRTLLTRALALGGDLGTLEETLDALFAGTADVSALADDLPDPGERVARKLVYLLEAARSDERIRHSLVLASRNHPGISLVLGQAFTEAQPAGARVSYEVRACPPGVFDPDLCSRVIGRVTLIPGQPTQLPAPGAPFAVLPEEVQQGHLNARLRWATPDVLRRRVVLHYGYDVLRVPTDRVATYGWNINLPDWNIEFARAEPRATRVNRFPILPEVLLDAVEADPDSAGAAPTNIYFFTDDNRRFEEGNVPFNNGAAFTYYVAARDILGRFGTSSPGSPVIIRDRLAPPPPRLLEAHPVSHPNSGQAIKVSFQTNISPMSNGEITKAYHLYRWSALEDIDIRSAATPIASLPHAGADSNGRLEFEDHAGLAGGPSVPGEIVWYTVRAEDASITDGAGNGNFSNHSRPVSAALRDLDAPTAPGGTVTVDCLEPFVDTLQALPPGLPTLEPVGAPDLKSLQLACFKKNGNEPFDWVEFWAGDTTRPNLLIARAYFPTPDAPFVVTSIEVPIPVKPGQTLDIYCRASARGNISEFSKAVMLDVSDNTKRFGAYFEAELQITRAPAGDDCPNHVGGGNEPEVAFDLPIDAVAWSILMRVDDGPYQLVAQGTREGDNNSVSVLIDALPPYARSLCLYLQVFDASGNGSGLRELACFGVLAPELPQPLLSSPEGIGTQATPMAKLSWFCPSASVDRFRLFVAVQGDESQVPLELSDELGLGGEFISPGPAPQHDEIFRSFETGRLTGDFPPIDNATFELNVKVLPGLTYIYYVQALGPNGEEGPVSNSQTFRWSPPEALYAACAAPLEWPAESVTQNFNQWQADLALRPIDQRIAVSQSNDPNVRGGVIVHIGQLSWNDLTKGQITFPASGLQQKVRPQNGTSNLLAYILPGNLNNFSNYLFEADLFPFVLYRAMVPSTKYVIAGGETYQVSPMIESVTKEVASDLATVRYSVETRIFDPHIFMDHEVTNTGDVLVNIYVRDTQPVIRGTRYQYFLVNFDARSKEITKVRSLGIIQIQ